MKKTSLLKENIRKMKKTSSKMPTSIYEAMYENDLFEDDEEPMEDDAQEEVPVEDDSEGVQGGNASQNAAQLIDNIRKEALKAMAELADTPEDENYLMLKKVWQMTDRKPEKEDKQGM